MEKILTETEVGPQNAPTELLEEIKSSGAIKDLFITEGGFHLLNQLNEMILKYPDNTDLVEKKKEIIEYAKKLVGFDDNNDLHLNEGILKSSPTLKQVSAFFEKQNILNMLIFIKPEELGINDFGKFYTDLVNAQRTNRAEITLYSYDLTANKLFGKGKSNAPSSFVRDLFTRELRDIFKYNFRELIVDDNIQITEKDIDVPIDKIEVVEFKKLVAYISSKYSEKWEGLIKAQITKESKRFAEKRIRERAKKNTPKKPSSQEESVNILRGKLKIGQAGNILDNPGTIDGNYSRPVDEEGNRLNNVEPEDIVLDESMYERPVESIRGAVRVLDIYIDGLNIEEIQKDPKGREKQLNFLPEALEKILTVFDNTNSLDLKVIFPEYQKLVKNFRELIKLLADLIEADDDKLPSDFDKNKAREVLSRLKKEEGRFVLIDRAISLADVLASHIQNLNMLLDKLPGDEQQQEFIRNYYEFDEVAEKQLVKPNGTPEGTAKVIDELNMFFTLLKNEKDKVVKKLKDKGYKLTEDEEAFIKSRKQKQKKS